MADGADYDSVLPVANAAANAPASDSSGTATASPVSTAAGADYDSVLPLQAQQAKGAAPIPGGGPVAQQPNYYGYIEKLSKHFEKGSAEIGSDLNSFVTLGLGNRSIEDFNKEDEARQQFAASLSKEDELDYHLKPAMDNALRPMGQTVGNVLAESAPSLGVGMAGMVAAGGVAALIGAPVVLPALAGGAIVGGVIGAGSMIRDLRQHGADPTVARIGGLAAGIANAATMFIGGGVTGKVAKDVIIKTGVRALAIDMAKAMGLNATAMVLNNVSDAGIKLVAAMNGAKYKTGQIQDELKQAIGTSLIAAPALAVGGAAAGTLLKTALKPVMRNEEALAALTKYFNKRSVEIESENYATLHAQFFGKVEEKVHAELYKPEGLSAVSMQGELMPETAQFEAARQLLRETSQAVDDLQQQVFEQRGKVFELEAQVTGEATTTAAQELSAEAQKNLPVEQAKLENLNKQLDEATQERNRVVAENEPAHLREQEAQQAVEEQAAVKEAEELNRQFRDALERKNIIDKAVLAASLKKGAGKVILKAEQAAKGQPLTPAQEELLKEKITLPRSPDEVFNLVAEITENLASHLPTSKVSGMSGMSLKFQLNTILQFLPPKEANRVSRTLDTTSAVNFRDITLTNLTNKLYGFVQESTGLSRKAVEGLAVKARKQKLTVTATGADGQSHTIKLSAGKMQAYLALMKNKKAKVALTDAKEGNNFTTRETHGANSTEAAFELALEKANLNYNKMIPGIARFYEEVGHEVKAFHDQRNPDNPFKLEINYGQQVRREGAGEPPQEGLTPEVPGMDIEPGESTGTGKGKALPPGIVKRRAANKGRIVAQDAFQSAQNHARIVANYFAFHDPSLLWSQLLGNQEFRHYVASNFGAQALKTLEAGYDYTVHGSAEPTSEVTHLVNFLLNAKAIQTLTWNWLYTPKHALTAFNGLLYEYEGQKLPGYVLMQASLDLLLHPSKATEILSRPEVNVRYTRKDYLATAAGTGKAANLISASITPGDKPAVATIVRAVEIFVNNLTNDPELATTEANHAPEQVLASSSTAKTTPTSRNLVTRYLTQFSGPEAVVASNVRDKWRIAANHPTRENLVNAFYTDFIGRSALVLFTIPSVAYVYGLAVATGNQKKAAEAAAMVANKGVVGAQFPLPSLIVPALATIIANRMFGTSFYVSEHGVPGLENVAELDEASAEAKKMIDGNKDLTLHNILETAIKSMQAFSVPAPLSQARGLKDATYQPQ
jgi:hypothetical protein